MATFSFAEDHTGTRVVNAFCVESRIVHVSGRDVPAGPTRESAGEANSIEFTSTISTGTRALTSSNVAVTVAFPAFLATTRPPGSTSATPASEELHDGAPAWSGSPFLSSTRADRRCARPMP